MAGQGACIPLIEFYKEIAHKMWGGGVSVGVAPTNQTWRRMSCYWQGLGLDDLADPIYNFIQGLSKGLWDLLLS